MGMLQYSSLGHHFRLQTGISVMTFTRMMTTTKFDIDKFDGKINFSIWQVQMLANLTNSGLKRAIYGRSKKPATMSNEEWEDLDDRALGSIQLCLSKEIGRAHV